MSKRIKYTAAGLVILLAGLGGAGYLYRKHQGRDIRGSSSVEFVTTEPKAAKEPPGVTWPLYGYNAARLRAPLGFKVHPPYRRAPVWTFRAGALLEFPPVIAYGRIYIVNNAGTVFAVNESRGKAVGISPHNGRDQLTVAHMATVAAQLHMWTSLDDIIQSSLR